MAITLDPNQMVSFEELLMSQVVQLEALTRLLVDRGIFRSEVKAADKDMRRERRN
jgi:hypothetical protein